MKDEADTIPADPKIVAGNGILMYSDIFSYLVP